MPERPDKQKNDALLRLTTETARYIVAGLVTTAVNFAVFGLLRPSGISAEVSQAAAITVSVVFAYAANKLYVFRSRAGSVAALALEFLKFIGGRAAAMLVEYYGFILLYPRFGEGLELVAKAIPQAVALAMNYAVSKLLVFTRRRDETKTPEQTGSTEQPNYKKLIIALLVLSALTAVIWNNAAVLKALDLFLTGKLSYLIIWAMLALPLLPLIPLVYCAVKLLQNRDPLREPPYKMKRYQRNWLIVILILNSLFYLMLVPCYLSKGRFIYPDAGRVLDAGYYNIFVKAGLEREASEYITEYLKHTYGEDYSYTIEEMNSPYTPDNRGEIISCQISESNFNIHFSLLYSSDSKEIIYDDFIDKLANEKINSGTEEIIDAPSD